jgi:predicted metalloendopeptidase
MIKEVKTAFINNLPNLKWMDQQTRMAAIDKVSSYSCSNLQMSVYHVQAFDYC